MSHLDHHSLPTILYYYLLSGRIYQNLHLVRFIMNQSHESFLHHLTKLDLWQHEHVSISTQLIYQLLSYFRPSKGLLTYLLRDHPLGLNQTL